MAPVLGLIAAVVWPITGRAMVSLVDNAPSFWNGVLIEGKVDVGYRPAGMPSSPLDAVSTASIFGVVGPDSHTAGDIVADSTFVDALPIVGEPKDHAFGEIDFSYTVGTGGSDTFTFDLSTETSAMTAMVDFGSGLEPADAFATISIEMSSFGPLATPGAQIVLPDLPTLDDPSRESMMATWQSPTDFLVFAPGDPGQAVSPLIGTGSTFSYKLDYTVITPFGEDPAHSYSLVGLASIPEPSLGALLLLGGVLLSLRRGRR